MRKHQNTLSSHDPSFPTCCNYTHNTPLHYLPDGSIYVEQNVLSLLYSSSSTVLSQTQLNKVEYNNFWSARNKKGGEIRDESVGAQPHEAATEPQILSTLCIAAMQKQHRDASSQKGLLLANVPGGTVTQ